MKRNVEVEQSSGNIFADIGVPDAETHLLKANIVLEIYQIVTKRKLTQTQAGKLMGISQPEVSRLFKGHFSEYSVERLMRFLTVFGRNVMIVATPLKKASKPGKITFAAKAA